MATPDRPCRGAHKGGATVTQASWRGVKVCGLVKQRTLLSLLPRGSSPAALAAAASAALTRGSALRRFRRCGVRRHGRLTLRPAAHQASRQAAESPQACFAAAATRRLVALVQTHRWQEVSSVFEELQLQRLPPDLMQLNAAINVFANCKMPAGAEDWLRKMQALELEPDRMSYGGVINSHARIGNVDGAEAWFKRMLQEAVEADTVSYSSVINACAQGGKAERAEEWLAKMLEDRVNANEVTYSSMVNACARAGQPEMAERWLETMLCKHVRANEVSYGTVMNAFAQKGDVESVEALVARMFQVRLEVTVVGCNSAIHAYARRGDVAGAERWLEQLRGQGGTSPPSEVTYNSVINACARAGEAQRAEHWLGEMLKASVRPGEVTYNSVINACASKGHTDRAEHWLERMLAARIQASVVSYNSVRTACARMGEVEKAELWLERMFEVGEPGEKGAWFKMRETLADDFARTGGHLKKALYRFSSCGDPAVVECLERALEYQWVYGYPRMPPGENQLTHGFFKYMAGMQPMTARELMKLTPRGGTILDVFCGSGTVLIEALVAGSSAFGCDVSPLAVFVASHHCDAGRVDLEELLARAEEVTELPKRGRCGWRLLRERLGTLPATPVREALWFIFAKALRVAAVPGLQGGAVVKTSGAAPVDPDDGLARPYMLSGVYRYAAQVRALRCAVGPGTVQIQHCDVRTLRLNEAADAIVTSPPYPGVYSYLGAAREDWSRVLGSGATASSYGSLDWGLMQQMNSGGAMHNFELSSELGTKALRSRHSNQEFSKLWQTQQEQWLSSAYANLCRGGTATLMIGDGDTDGDTAIDCLQSTLDAATVAGFETLATASIESCADVAHRAPGMLRTEHMVHLRKP